MQTEHFQTLWLMKQFPTVFSWKCLIRKTVHFMANQNDQNDSNNEVSPSTPDKVQKYMCMCFQEGLWLRFQRQRLIEKKT